MWSRKWVLMLIAAAALVFTAVWLAFRPRAEGPMVNNRPLSQWVEELGRRRFTTEPRPAAEAAILDSGTNALPYLLLWIQSEARPWRHRLP